MPEIKSPIGNVSISGDNQLPTFKVEDPTIQEAHQERLPVEPPVRSSTPQKISAEQYNQYKQRIQESNFTVKSTDDFDYDAVKGKTLNADDEQFLKFF